MLPSQDNINSIGETPSCADLAEDKMWLKEMNQTSWAVFHTRRETELRKLNEDISTLLPI